MTPAQIQLYGRRWGAVCHANDWRMERGRLVGGPRCEVRGANGEALAPHTSDLPPHHAAVFALARQHAAQNSRAITPEDLRKACVCYITGRFQSAKDLTNAQFSRLLTLFRLLINPDDLDAVMDWDHPDRDEVKRVKYFIEHAAPDAYVRAIAAGRFGARLWEDLELWQLKQLANTLRARRGRWNQSRQASGPAGRRRTPSPGGEGRGEGAHIPASNCPF